MHLTYRQLEILHAVARHGTVTAAAEALGVSQPAVSMMLRESQVAVGFQLFGRSKGRPYPTAELGVILAEMDRVFQGVARIDRLIEGIRDMTVGSVVIAATPTLADHLLPRALATFRRSRPGIQITLQTMDNLGVVEAVAKERVDVGFVLTPLVASDLRVVPLDETELVCAVPTSHPLADRNSVAVHDLMAWPLIGVGRGLPLGDLVEAAFAAEGLPRRIAIEVTQTSVALSLVRAGAGIAIVDPYGAMSGVPADITLLHLHPRISVGAAAIIQRGRSLSRATRMVIATARRTASNRAVVMPDSSAISVLSVSIRGMPRHSTDGYGGSHAATIDPAGARDVGEGPAQRGGRPRRARHSGRCERLLCFAHHPVSLPCARHHLGDHGRPAAQGPHRSSAAAGVLPRPTG